MIEGANILESSIVSKQSTSTGISYMRELDKLQEQQFLFTRKIEIERLRRAQIAEETEVHLNHHNTYRQRLNDF